MWKLFLQVAKCGEPNERPRTRTIIRPSIRISMLSYSQMTTFVFYSFKYKLKTTVMTSRVRTFLLEIFENDILGRCAMEEGSVRNGLEGLRWAGPSHVVDDRT